MCWDSIGLLFIALSTNVDNAQYLGSIGLYLACNVWLRLRYGKGYFFGSNSPIDMHLSFFKLH